jgi:hypothetical protein
VPEGFPCYASGDKEEREKMEEKEEESGFICKLKLATRMPPNPNRRRILIAGWCNSPTGH